MQPRASKIALSSGELSFYAAGEGRPLVYLHPAGGVRWTKVQDELAKSFKLQVPIMPGFDGAPAHASVKSMRALAGLAAEFIEKTVSGPCDLIGCSFGGYLAAWLVAERPDLVDHLVLECPAGFRPKGRGGRPPDPEELKKLLFLHPEKLPPETKSADVEAANRRMLPHYGYSPDTDEDLLARLPAIDKLTLILHGTADRMIPKESVQLLKSRLPHAYLVYIWDAAHAIEVDQPERMLAVLTSFLQRSEGFMVNWGTLAVNPG
ncbi:MAG TPA: alpha/beta hydrolase [Burkholderiales bacterium]|nr:alpha/beta hydrolase [Burkholderiales bacterium]